MDIDTGAESKQDMRRRIRAARREMSEEQREQAGSVFRDTLSALPQLTMGGTVAVYYSVGTEPDTHKLIATLWKQGTYVLLPVFLPNRDLDWAAYDGPDSLESTDQGLLEPTGRRYGVDAVRRCAAVVCPALAVDQRGLRLGKGAGCYDRTLSRIGPNTRTIAVIYDTELVDAVPAEAHDRPVHGVVTPQRGVHWF
ncbi:5-formyltetrahydrofolate cyclo-ligase [Lipingzhangella halophila]|uniref:5-formyltetrahydrofolate cyclo-ligase n=1 Tax=Lipingzhangella halophila TaxID=1783352 RepID=A0A7W7RCV8_9ACTN|nr:5-formyltetrahydrofolate cyclo-ligase [Lipingzhangella halophila]MBB4929680.1 5-formyltetrahydrofolate cyclo-ligase [Lipingzhangella halophila]